MAFVKHAPSCPIKCGVCLLINLIVLILILSGKNAPLTFYSYSYIKVTNRLDSLTHIRSSHFTISITIITIDNIDNIDNIFIFFLTQ